MSGSITWKTVENTTQVRYHIRYSFEGLNLCDKSMCLSINQLYTRSLQRDVTAWIVHSSDGCEKVEGPFELCYGL